jgi:hypothetical protein
VPGRLDFNGMLAGLGSAARPAPAGPLEGLAAAESAARAALSAFGPPLPGDQPQPVSPRGRRPSR